VLRPPIEPMLAAPVDRLPQPGVCRGGCAYEPKFDGYRALVFVQDADALGGGGGGGVVVQSRRGADITSSFPDIADAAGEQLPVGTVVDGELVVLGAGGVLEFAALQRRLGGGRRSRRVASEQPAAFLAFDVLASGGRDLRSRPLVERRRELERLMERCSPPVQLVPQTTDAEQAREWLEQYAAAPVGLEGVVIKGLGDAYQGGRRGWQKLRVRNTHEVVLGAVTGTLHKPGRLVVGLYDAAGDLVVAGGTAELSPRQSELLVPHLEPPRGRHPWPTELPAGRMGHFGGGTIQVTLVEPLVVEVSADQSFEYGKWRHLTRFVRPRPDLTPAEIPTLGA